VSLVRRLLLMLVAFGLVGLAAELALIEHYEEWQQVLPLAALGAGAIALGALALRPARVTVRVFQAVMVAFVVLGGAGIYLHYSGNVEFELEMAPDARGLALVWSALRGATPALAPGALAQLGLLGLIAAVRHPARRAPGPWAN
jgi:hypothetical protein